MAITRRYLVLLPALLTLLLLAWTALVWKYADYGTWHIYPALAVAPLVLLAHAALVTRSTPRAPQALYAVLHLVLFIPIWILCLILISKDSL
jgi:hypothetical protein